MDDKLQHQSQGIGHDSDRTMLSLLDSRSTSDHGDTCQPVKDINQFRTIWHPPYGHYPVTTLVMI
ncbi:hypothetical protein DPMN_075618 [Dreissena polymorpha]|uniref:Uncharacterized protein n=1 Tax=Dreissena polymorpha TaxID=45954 RepID=A0A9D3YIG5_DREPO|nr:hypothetical protein DPMN_075618 [Dreissena polymorpha]